MKTPSLKTPAMLFPILFGVIVPTAVQCSSLPRQHVVTMNVHNRQDPEVKMNATQLITSKGFPCENFYVTTEDGYILNILRISHGRNNSKYAGPRPVVVLQHGLLGSCTNFLTNPVNESLAYILADAGADVWLGNSRGNLYSTNHTRLDPKKAEFWNFSWDDMAKYDLLAMINFIVSKSGVDQVYYVGHSQGTAIGFVQFGEDQELASHIKHFIAMAPIARIWNTESPLKKLAPVANQISNFFNLFGHGAFQLDSEFVRYLSADLCDKWGATICANWLFSSCGFDFQSFNLTRMPVYMAHNPAGTSVSNILHYAQEINSKNFQAFDFGSEEENMKHYHQKTPPIYDLKKVKVPVSIFRGGQDYLADPTDVNWMLPQLNVTHDFNIPHYAHLDFIWAFDTPTVIYRDVLKIVFS